MLAAVGFNAPERARGLGLADSRDIEVSEVASGGPGGAGEGRGDAGIIIIWFTVLTRVSMLLSVGGRLGEVLCSWNIMFWEHILFKEYNQ